MALPKGVTQTKGKVIKEHVVDATKARETNSQSVIKRGGKGG